MSSPTESTYFSSAKNWVATTQPVIKLNRTWTSIKSYEYKNKFLDLTSRVNNAALFIAFATAAVALFAQPTSSFGKYVASSFIATILLPEVTNRVVDQVKELYAKTHLVEIGLIVSAAVILVQPTLFPKVAALTLGAYAAKTIQDRNLQQDKSVKPE